jgi:hypothetical protein
MQKKEKANREIEEALKRTVLNCASTKMDIRILKNIDAAFNSSNNNKKNSSKKQKQNITEISLL